MIELVMSLLGCMFTGGEITAHNTMINRVGAITCRNGLSEWWTSGGVVQESV